MRPIFSVATVATSILLGLAAPALAQLPADRTLKLEIHSVPSDPESPVDFIVVLELTAEDVDGDAVGWAVTSIRIGQLDEWGFTIGDWSQSDPVVASTDGLWWLEHADGENPTTSEFVILPTILGTAAPELANDPDLDFFLEGTGAQPDPDYPFPTGGIVDVGLVLDDETVLKDDEGSVAFTEASVS
jgi:hypothetical protein